MFYARTIIKIGYFEIKMKIRKIILQFQIVNRNILKAIGNKG